MKKWHATILYRHDDGIRCYGVQIDEVEDLDQIIFQLLHDTVESGYHFDTIEGVILTRINHVVSPTLTVEQAETLPR